MVSRVGASHGGARYDTEQLTAVQQAISVAEEAFLEAKTQAEEHMKELPRRLKVFLKGQLSSLASACGFSVDFSEPSNGVHRALWLSGQASHRSSYADVCFDVSGAFEHASATAYSLPY